jgi:hypothetical protein
VSERPKKNSRTGWQILSVVLYSLLTLGLLLGTLPGALEALCRDFQAEVTQPLPPRAAAHYRTIRDHLQQPFTGYSARNVMVPQFGVIALSHMAGGLMNLSVSRPDMKSELAPLIDEVAARAVSPYVSPWDEGPERVADLDDQGLYLSHLNVVLGCQRAITGSDKYEALHTRISRHLAARSLRDGDFHAASYPPDFKWPADQAATLCSLYLYDQTHGATLSAAPLAGWLVYMHTHGDAVTGLHYSAVTDFPYRTTPRGCAMSQTLLYMSQFAPAEAAPLYLAYRRHFFSSGWGAGGFREWPRDREASMDVDSGPVVFGVGAAASGLGVGPARLFGDAAAYAGIMRSLSLTTMPRLFGNRSHLLMPLLAEAILFDGETAVPWYQPLPPAGTVPPQVGFPTLPLVMVCVELALAGVLLWRIRALVRQLRRRWSPVSTLGTKR